MALVFRIIGDCPGCGGVSSFGNIAVRERSVLRGCRVCKYREHIPLPPIRKKLLYLDQSFFSAAFKSDSTRNEQYVRVANRISDLAQRQLLVVPYSSLHADEAFQWSGYAGHSGSGLWEYIKQISGGFELETPISIQRAQLLAGFRDFQSLLPVRSGIHSNDAFPDDVNCWNDYHWIGLSNDYLGDASSVRASKEKMVDELLDLLPTWKLSSNDFAADLREEYKGAGSLYRNAFADFVDRLERGDFLAQFNADSNSLVIENMMTCFEEDVSGQHRARVIVKFFESEYFRAAPYQHLSSHLFALLRERVRLGAYSGENTRERLKGLFLDIEHAATYAPYCDAIFLDRAMAGMMTDMKVGLEKRFGTRAFGPASWRAFEEWLDSIDVMSPEHSNALKIAYPDILESGV